MQCTQHSESQMLRVIVRFGLVILMAAMFCLPSVNANEAVERGTKNYLQFCQGCHGVDKAGLANFQGELQDLQAILDGETNQMPDFYGVFSDDEVADIFAFLQVTE